MTRKLFDALSLCLLVVMLLISVPLLRGQATNVIPPSDCTVTPISNNQIIGGRVDYPYVNCPTNLPIVYSVEFTSGDQIRVAAASDQFDPVLYLLDSNGVVVAANDNGGGGWNSLINITAPATGTYYIEVTSFSGSSLDAHFILSVGIPTIPSVCSTIPISNNQIRVGFFPYNCPSAHRYTSFAQYYSFSASAGDTIRVELNSTEVDPVLFLLDSSGAVIAYNDDGGGGWNSLIETTAPATGAYYVEAASFSSFPSNGRNFLTFGVPAGIPPQCTVTPVTYDERVVDDFSPYDCPSTHRVGSLAHYYSFTGNAGQDIRVQMHGDSIDFDSLVYFLDGTGSVIGSNDDGGGGWDALLNTTAPATGVYYIEATTANQVVTSQTFSVALGDPVTPAFIPSWCTATPISNSDVVTGMFNCGSIHRTSSARYYKFTAVAGQDIRIAMKSFAFDPLVYLLDKNGWILAGNDNGGGGTDALIEMKAPATDTYYIEAAATEGGYNYGFVLALGVPKIPSACTVVPINNPVRMTGSLSSCPSSHRFGSLARFYSVTLQAGQDVRVAMYSQSYDTLVYLLDSTGSVLAYNANGSGARPSEIRITAPASGTYYVEATSLTGNTTGPFTLTLGTPAGLPAACVVTPMQYNQVLADSLAGYCASADQIGMYARYYSFAATAEQPIRVALYSSGFDGVVYLLDPNGTVLTYNANGAGARPSEIQTKATAAGTYYVEVASLSGTTMGSFILALGTPGVPANCVQSFRKNYVERYYLSQNCASAHHEGSYASYLPVTLVQGETVTITVSSTDFDPVLYVLDPSGSVIAYNDDGGGGWNSSFKLTPLMTGTYMIEATSFYGFKTGYVQVLAWWSQP